MLVTGPELGLGLGLGFDDDVHPAIMTIAPAQTTSSNIAYFFIFSFSNRGFLYNF
jgi:hypothetical protein